MINKIKKTSLLIFENILIKYCVTRGKITNFLSFGHKIKNKEAGFLATSTFILIGVGLGVLFTAGGVAYSFASDKNLSFYQSIIFGASMIVYNGCKALAAFANSLFDTAYTITAWPVTTFSVYTTGWTSVRDIANMFIVLGFVVVGIATALRFKEYESKKLLPPLIILALIINFSGLFCGVIIDASNIAFKSAAAGSSTFSTNIYSSMAYCLDGTPKTDGGSKNASPVLNDALAKTSPEKFFGLAIESGLIWMAYTGTFIYMAVLLIARYVMLAILYILSPLAFLCWVFPPTKKLWTMWWENFLKWAFIGVAGGFFLGIGASVLSGFITSNTEGITVFSLLVVLMFFFIGFKITTKTSAMGAGAVIGLTAGAIGFATGAVGGVATKAGMASLKGLGKATGVTEAATKAGHKMTGWAERAGLVKSGTSAGWEKERVQKDKKQYDNMTSRDLAADVNRGAATTSGRRANDIKAQILAERGDFDKIGYRGEVGITPTEDDKIREQVARRAIANDKTGEVISSFKKANPLYAGFDERAKKDLTSQYKPGTKVRYTEKEAEDKLVGGAFKNADVEARSKFSPDTLKDPRYLMNTTAKQMAKASERMSADRIQAHKDLLIGGGVMDGLRTHPDYVGNPAKLAELDEKEIAINAMH